MSRRQHIGRALSTCWNLLKLCPMDACPECVPLSVPRGPLVACLAGRPLVETAAVQGCHVEDLVDDAREGRRGVDDDAVRGVFSRLVQPLYELTFRLPSAPLVFRSLVEPLSVSRSTSRTKTPSNRPMKSEKFLDPPQKNVSAPSWLATKALTFSTCQRW